MPEIVDESGDILPAATNLFGKYELGRLLGYGGFAKVYHARDVRTGQSVAIKAINKQRLVKGGLTGHVKREVSIMRRLRHHHIVRLMEVLATKTKIYFVLEFAKGGELFTKVAKGRFSEDLCRRYFQQLIAAVGYCHSHGVFHRDLKLENLLLDENWDLKVTDFGLSAVRDQIQPDGDGLLHTLCGTPAYVAPEILAKKGYDGARVDLWSCGVILFVLNAGYLPFNDPNLMIMYKKIYNGDYRCPKWTSPDLKRLISRLLDTNPQTRISIAEMLDDPWFRKGYKEIKFKFHSDDFEIKEENRADADMFLNAFDIISYSPGIDLSSLFNRQEPKLTSRRFVSALPPPAIIAEIDSAARAEGLNVTSKKEFWVKLEEHNGNFVAAIEIRRLTESLAVVEVKRRDSAADAAGPSRDFWREKLSPILTRLVYSPPGEPVAGL